MAKVPYMHFGVFSTSLNMQNIHDKDTDIINMLYKM